MGKFIVSRSAEGDRFVLRSASGHTLAVSRCYATLDACKKGIASLIVNAPVVPVRDLTAGERGANPKFEITGEEGAFLFVLKSANGKAVVTSVPYATKKACLRAIAMLRAGVADYEILFERKGETVPLTMKPPVGAAVSPAARDTAPLAALSETAAPAEASIAPVEESEAEPTEAVAADGTPTDAPAAETRPLSVPAAKPQSATVTVPRLIRVKPAESAAAACAVKKEPAPRAKGRVSPPPKRGLLQRLFKK